jgi:molecular chaperone GrpE
MDHTDKDPAPVDTTAAVDPGAPPPDGSSKAAAEPPVAEHKAAEDPVEPLPKGQEPPAPVAEPEPIVIEEPDEEPVDPIEQAKQETERFRNQMLRIAADFDNFRKRSRREIEDASRRSREDLLRELLPVFDNLERAATHAEQATEARAVADGVKMVLRQFQDTLSKVGVARIKAVGAPFDPNFHEAIQQIESADQPAGTVMAEVLSGYTWDDRLVRASMVVVSKAPVPSQPPSEPTPEPAAQPPVEPGSEQ